jgi:hypothetical protein
MMVDKYDPITGRTLLSRTVEKVFKTHSSSQYLQTVTDYTYNEGDYLTGWNYEVNKIKTTHSNGDTTIKYIKYSGNYSGIYSDLTNDNISTLPVSVATSFIKKGTTAEYYTGESVTEYTTLANGNVVPAKTLVQRFAEPQPSASMQFYGSSPAYKEPQTLIYDAHNNLSGIKDEGGRTVTNIYDYNDKYVAATVINADPNLDKPAYTSFETNDFTRSGWAMTGTPSYNSASSVTGARSLTLSSGKSLSATLNTAKPYKLSFWASSSGIVVNGNATLVKSAPTLNGFTYYEYNIAQGASSVTVSGSSNIDELRLYPANARMSTVTYDPLIGKTSECDENNRITYYEYDELGRMRYIKDENKNIVKMYEYNVKSKATGCPTTYYNLPVSEVFTKNNCSAGYTGGDVTYTIPGSKYTSTVSQDEVDQKVQAELDANAQAYANANGACIKLYYNTAKSQVFTKGGCDIGYKGTTITYTVPANKYTSTISQADADEQAQDDIDANGDALVNLPGNGSCVVDTDPYWQGEENSPTDCRLVNGVAHRFVEVTDINPNSATHNQTQWVDAGEDAACPVSSVMYGRIEKENILGVNPEYSDFFIRFYADPYYTIPLSVSNYTVSFTFSESLVDQYGVTLYLNQTQQSVTCDGFETLIGSAMETYEEYGDGSVYSADYYFNQVEFPIQ